MVIDSYWEDSNPPTSRPKATNLYTSPPDKARPISRTETTVTTSFSLLSRKYLQPIDLPPFRVNVEAQKGTK